MSIELNNELGTFIKGIGPCRTCGRATCGASNSRELCNCSNQDTVTQDLGIVSDTIATTPIEQTIVALTPRKISQIELDNVEIIDEAIRIAKEKSVALKFDDNKVPVELLPTQALEEIAKVLAFGAKKYDSWNWAKGFKWTRLIGAAIRHLYAYQRGEDKDPESGLSHLAHAGCCILFLLQHEISGLGQDDRFKGFQKGDRNV